MKTKQINIAPSSTEGHFITTKNVVEIDKINETFLVKETSDLISANHTSLVNQPAGIITCQTVYNPFTKLYEQSKD